MSEVNVEAATKKTYCNNECTCPNGKKSTTSCISGETNFCRCGGRATVSGTPSKGNRN